MKRNVLVVLVSVSVLLLFITIFIALAVWPQEAASTSNSESEETASEEVGDNQDDPDLVQGGETSKQPMLGEVRLPTAKKYGIDWGYGLRDNEQSEIYRPGR